MKLCLAPGPRRPLDRQTAWGCLTTNQLVLPGLGSLVAGRRIGFVQAALALAGMAMTLTFGVLFLHQFLSLGHLPETPEETMAFWEAAWPPLKRSLAGMGLFGFGWCWALSTSLALLHEARRATAVPPLA